MNAVLGYLDASDRRVAWRLQGWAPPRWFRTLTLVSTRLGDGWLWIAAALILAADAHHGATLFAAVALAAAVANGALIVLKRRFRRTRPADCAPNPFFASVRPELFVFDHFSFPSGHALNAFAACSMLALASPLLAPAALLLASSVAASRVVLGLHFLSDVLVGAALGVAIGVGALLLVVR